MLKPFNKSIIDINKNINRNGDFVYTDTKELSNKKLFINRSSFFANCKMNVFSLGRRKIMQPRITFFTNKI